MKSPPVHSKLIKGAASLAAVTASSDAALVQITLTGNQFTTLTNNLNADLTGDLGVDVAITGASVINSPFLPGMMIPGPPNMIPIGFSTTSFGAMITTAFSTTTPSTFFPGNPGSYGVRASFEGIGAIARTDVSSYGVPAGAVSSAPGGGATGGVALNFSDGSIFGGASTAGFLEIIADGALGTITLTRLVFDDGAGASVTPNAANVVGNTTIPEFSAIPEPSSLALLALGAGGLAFRRGRKKVD